MRRLWIRWGLLLIFVVVMATVFVNLGEWQLRRLHERQARNEVVRTNSTAAPVPFSTVFGEPITEQKQWQQVSVRGTFDPDHQIQVRYRENNGVPGYEVVTPLRTETGPVVLVNRGFIAVPPGQPLPTTLPAPPAGQVTLTGHVRRDEQGKPVAIDPVENRVRLINSVAIAKALPYPIVNGYLGALTMEPAQQDIFQPVALPDLSEGPHLSYAIQWFMFSVIAVAGLFVFIRSDLRERKGLKRAARPATPADEIATHTKE